MSETENRKVRMKDYRKAQTIRLDIIAELYKRGYSYRDIRTEVMNRLDLSTYSLRTVSKDVNKLLEEWRATRIENLDLALQLELERIDDLTREAWTAWNKSKEDQTLRNNKQKGVPGDLLDTGNNASNNGNTPAESNPAPERREEIVTVAMEQQTKEVICTGDPRYLEIIHKLSMERRKLLGLYAPEKKNISGSMTFEALLMETGIIEDEEGY